MTERMEYKGKDVDDAINKACTALNVSREQLSIEVDSMGSAGIFGLCRKKASVLVSLKAADDKKYTEKKSAKPNFKKTEVIAEPVAPETLDVIKADLLKLLELIDCPSKVTVSLDENNKVLGHIEGDDLETIIGPEGQTLDGLQYLVRKMISRKFSEKIMISLDAGDFRANRMKELQEKAVKLAQEVKDTGKTRTISAINPAERRIVHMALQDDKDIRSRSIGEGLFKKVLIYPPGKGRRRYSKKQRRSKPNRRQ